MEKTTAISLFEKMDEDQIIKADKAIKQAMVYETSFNGQKVQEITYTGVKHLILQLSTKGHPLKILESECKLEKDDPNDKETWHWRAYKKFINANTGLDSDGRSECPYLERIKEYKDKKWTGKWIIGEYDPFAQRKADSKAERNAQRKQIPELVIKEFLKSVNKDDIQNLEEPSEPNTPSNPEVCHCDWSKMSNNKGRCGNCNKPLTIAQIQRLEKH